MSALGAPLHKHRLITYISVREDFMKQQLCTFLQLRKIKTLYKACSQRGNRKQTCIMWSKCSVAQSTVSLICQHERLLTAMQNECNIFNILCQRFLLGTSIKTIKKLTYTAKYKLVTYKVSLKQNGNTPFNNPDMPTPILTENASSTMWSIPSTSL